jgi:hypothetical protein
MKFLKKVIYIKYFNVYIFAFFYIIFDFSNYMFNNIISNFLKKNKIIIIIIQKNKQNQNELDSQVVSKPLASLFFSFKES